jgi:hypothetical protein
LQSTTGLLLYTDWASPSMYTTLQNQYQSLLAGRTTPQAMAKAVQDDWAKFDKTLLIAGGVESGAAGAPGQVDPGGRAAAARAPRPRARRTRAKSALYVHPVLRSTSSSRSPRSSTPSLLAVRLGRA